MAESGTTPAPRDRIAAIREEALRLYETATPNDDADWSGLAADLYNALQLMHVSVLAAGPTTNTMICPGCGEAVTLDWADGWRNDNGFTCQPTNTTHSQHVLPALAALAPEPAETTRGPFDDSLISRIENRLEVGLRSSAGYTADEILLRQALGQLARAAAGSPDEPKPLDPAPYVSRRFGGRRKRPNLEYSICQPRPEFDQDESHYPKDGK